MFRRTLCALQSTNRVLFEVEGKVATLTMQEGPVNVLNRGMLTDLSAAFDEVEKSPALEGVILTSSLPGLFSAGLDIFEMANPSDEEDLRAYWTLVQNMWLKLYDSTFTTVAAVNGAAPAGGCMMACACDYRVMIDSPKATIGLNETQLGLTAPFWLVESYIQTMATRRLAELHLTRGDLLTAPQALANGLVDELSEDPLAAARNEMARFLKINPYSRSATKRHFRSELASKLRGDPLTDADAFVAIVRHPSVQQAIHSYINGLKSKK